MTIPELFRQTRPLTVQDRAAEAYDSMAEDMLHEAAWLEEHFDLSKSAAYIRVLAEIAERAARAEWTDPEPAGG